MERNEFNIKKLIDFQEGLENNSEQSRIEKTILIKSNGEERIRIKSVKSGNAEILIKFDILIQFIDKNKQLLMDKILLN